MEESIHSQEKHQPAGNGISASDLFELSPAPITVVDRNGRIVSANKEAERTLGLSADGMTGRTYNDLGWRITDYGGNPFPEEKLPVRQVLDSGRAVYGVEHAIERPSGKRTYLRINAAPVWSDSGELTYVVAMALDVTGRTLAEMRLREREDRFRALFEQSLDAIWVSDYDGTIREVNDAWLKLFGYTRSEALGMNAVEVYPSSADRTRFLKEIEDKGSVRNTVTFKRKDGSRFECERTVAALRNDTGEITTFQGVARDVTEQRRAERALRESEERYRLLFDQAGEAISIVTPEGWLMDANKAFLDMFGYSREELHGLHVTTLYADPTEREGFLRRMAEDGAVRDELWYRKRTGELILCQRSATSVRDESGELVAFQAFVRDITEQRRIEKALQESEDKYRSLFEQSREAITIVALDGTILDANQAWLDLFGYDREELSAMNITAIYDEPGQRREFLRRMAADGFVRDELWYRKRDGTPILCERTVSAWKDQDGKAIAFQAFARDVTEERRTASELRESVRGMNVVTNTTVLTSSLSDIDKILETAGKSMLELNPGSHVSVSLYDRLSGAINVRTVLGLGDMTREVLRLLGRDPRELSISIGVQDAALPYTSGHLEEAPGGLFEVMGGTLSRKVCTALERLLDIGKTYTIGFVLDGAVYGGITLFLRRGSRLEHGQAIETIAHHVAVTIQRQMNANELRRTTEQLRSLAQRVQQAREDERRGIARELHDQIGQELTALRLDISSLRSHASGDMELDRSLQELDRLVDLAARDVRQISSELRPGVLDDVGLAGALEWQVEEYRRRTTIDFEVHVIEPPTSLDDARRTALFRVFQELATNAVRHSRATRVSVSLSIAENSVVLIVADNGQGISSDNLEDPGTLGMVGMRERLQPFGGELHYETAPGKGTTARATMPLAD